MHFRPSGNSTKYILLTFSAHDKMVSYKPRTFRGGEIMQENLSSALYACIKEATEAVGVTPASILSALGELYGVYVDDSLIHAAMGMRVCDLQGSLHDAGLGVSQFLSVASRRCSLEKEAYLSLCETWNGKMATLLDISDCQSNEDAYMVVLRAACEFFDSEGEILHLEIMDSKPRQYYDQILVDRESMFHHSPFALEEKLSKAVTRGDRKAAVAALREIGRQGDKAILAKDPLRSAKNSMIGSIAFLARAAIQAGVNADKAFALSDSLTQHVEDMTSRKAVLAFEENILLQFIDLVNVQLETAYSVSIARVMHYIENNLNKKVTLSDAAAYAGIHPAYLSARFKKETGSDFSGFVSRRKIQESAYFVRHTQYSVSQIAFLYGFSSQSYYITTFKRVLGMTPMVYRARYLSK